MKLPGATTITGILRRLLPSRSASALPPVPLPRGTIAIPSRSERVLNEATAFYERADRLASPSTRRYERIANRHADIAGRAWFLPYLDSLTGETAEMRAAYKKMLASPYIKSALLYKVSAVAALDWQVQAANPKSPRDLEACEFLRHSIDRTADGMPGVIMAILAPMLVEGYSVAEKVVEIERAAAKYAGKITLAAIKPKPSELFALECDAFNNVLGIRGMGVNTGECWPIRDFVYTRNLAFYGDPRGMSDFRAAYGDYWMHDTVSKLRAIHAEKRTSPFMLGEYVEQDDKAALEAALAAAKTSTWMSVPEGVKIQALNMAGQGEGDFKSFCDDKQKGMLIAILGAYLQVLEGSTPDGRGNATVSKSVTELLIWLLAATAQRVVTQQIFRDLISWNYAGVECPQLVLGGVSEQEVQAILANLAAAQQIGMKLSASDASRRTSFQAPSGPDDELKPAAAQQPPGGGFGGMPFSERGRGVADTVDSDEFADVWEEFDAGDWTGPHKGERGGTYWMNRVSGETSYKNPAGGKLKRAANYVGRKAKAAVAPVISKTIDAKDLIKRPSFSPRDIGLLKERAKAAGADPAVVASLDGLEKSKVAAAVAAANKLPNAEARRQALQRAYAGGMTPEKAKKLVDIVREGGASPRTVQRLERAVDPEYRKKIAAAAAKTATEAQTGREFFRKSEERFGKPAATAMWLAYHGARFSTKLLTIVPVVGGTLADQLGRGAVIRGALTAGAYITKYTTKLAIWPIKKLAGSIFRKTSEGWGGGWDSFAEDAGAMSEVIAEFRAAMPADSPEMDDEQIEGLLDLMHGSGMTEADAEAMGALSPDYVATVAILDAIASGDESPELIGQLEESMRLVSDEDLDELYVALIDSIDENNPTDTQAEALVLLEPPETDGENDSDDPPEDDGGPDGEPDIDDQAPEVASPDTFQHAWGFGDASRPWDWGLSLAIEAADEWA